MGSAALTKSGKYVCLKTFPYLCFTKEQVAYEASSGVSIHVPA